MHSTQVRKRRRMNLCDTTIDIYCDAESHAGRRWRCGQFVLDVADPADPLYYPDFPPLWVFGEDVDKVGPTRLSGIHEARAWIDETDGHVVTQDEMISRPGALDNAYMKWRFECGLCGLTFVRRHEALTVTLDQLRAAEVRWITLGALCGTV
jgi:hypothetical protein